MLDFLILVIGFYMMLECRKGRFLVMKKWMVFAVMIFVLVGGFFIKSNLFFIEFDNAKIEKEIRNQIKNPFVGISVKDLEMIEEIHLSDIGTTNLQNFDYMVNLRSLRIYNSNITDLSPIANLDLFTLSLCHDNINDISVLVI